MSQAQQGFQNASANFLTGNIGGPAAPYTGGAQNTGATGALASAPTSASGLTAGLSPAQVQNIATQGALGQVAAPTTAQGLNTLGFTAAGGYLNDPFTQDLAARTRAQFFQQDVPQLEAPFIMAGQSGGSTPGQAALNTAGAQLETGLAGLQENAYQAERQLQQQAAGAAVPLGLTAGTTGLEALTMPQQTEQTALQAQLQEYLRQQAQPWQAALGMPSLTGQTTQTLYGQSPFQDIASALTPAFMFSRMFPAFFA